MKALSLMLLLMALPAFATSRPEAPADRYRGHLYVGPENETFYPCGNKTGYWFLASTATRDRLISEGLAKSGALSEQGVFVEVEGKIGRRTNESDESASKYPAFFHISRVVRVKRVKPSDCQP
jgi:hypothetical protein